MRAAVVIALILPSAVAFAQDMPPEVKVTPVVEGLEPTTQVDLHDIVLTATKSISTVQESPSIVTIITADDIRRWGFRDLTELLGSVPGWFREGTQGNSAISSQPRGFQPALTLRDGIPMVDSFGQTPWQERVPLEELKRVEVMTGPGGVLWGADSFLGIANLISKDADDVDGVELSASYGDGRGDRSDIRTYALFGQSLLAGRLKVFAHARYTSYVGEELSARQNLATSLPPQPVGVDFYGPYVTSDAHRSWLATFDGKAQAGRFQLYWGWTSGHMLKGMTVPGSLIGDTPAMTIWGSNLRNDPKGIAHNDVENRYDRYVGLEYHEDFAQGRYGVSSKVYATQAVFQLDPLVFFPASQLIQGGVTGFFDPSTQRIGSTVDGHLRVSGSNRLLWGGELFREWGDTAPTTFLSPSPRQVPFQCPRDPITGDYKPNCPYPFVFAASREVGAVYLSDQWHLMPTLFLDGGARLQAGFGERPYDAQGLFSGSVVWGFMPSWHFKANYSQGFRPPVFNDTDSNGVGATIAGNRYIKPERSEAWQGEINARLTPGRRVRLATFRLDYSYSLVDNLIVVQQNHYQNSGRRGIHSVEFLGRANLTGDHILQIGYTFLDVNEQGKSLVLSTPNHWFNIFGSINLLPNRLDLISTLLLFGATQDPNRMVVPTAGSFCYPDRDMTPANCGGSASPGQITFDRLPAVALWNLGLRWRGIAGGRIELDTFVYNLLDSRWYQPDGFYDLAPTGDSQPLPGQGFSFLATARYHFER